MTLIPAECFPVVIFIDEELDARNIRREAFFQVIGIDANRWDQLHRGQPMLLSECQKIGGALQLDPMFLHNLNRLFVECMRQHEGKQ